MPDTDNWPSFADELGRKGAETLKKWVERYEAGTITRRDLYIAADVIFDCTSGLAPWDVPDAAAAVLKELRPTKG